jgi:hypothetical protein
LRYRSSRKGTPSGAPAATPRPFRPQVESLETRDVPAFYGNQLFPLDNPWNQVISSAPVAANSDAVIARIVNRHSGTAPKLHADFSNPTDGSLYGIPVNVVDSSVPKVPVVVPSFGYAGESDLVSVPIPANAVIEGDGPTGPAPSASRGDSHLLVYDKTANVLYELYCAARPSEVTYPYGGAKPTGTWGAYQISFWDLKTNYFRTIGETSADAAGLPILPGLVRPDEALPASAGGQGAITHAIRMTVQQTASLFAYPASHEASSQAGSDLPRMGERFRLKASFPIPSTWSPEARAIAQAMKDYGLIVADNGSDMYFQGTPSDRWNMSSVLQVQQIRATDLEVVDLTPVVTGLSVASGLTGGGTSITISGHNFGGAAGQLHVLFGGVEATSVVVVSDSVLVAVAPPHAAGAVDVRVQSGTVRTDAGGSPVFFGYGTSAVNATDLFSFLTLSPPPVSPPPVGGSSAAYVGSDAATQGSWQGVYGSAGYDLATGPAALPAYAAVTPAGQQNCTWDRSAADPRALQVPGSPGRLAAVWYSNSAFTVDLNLTDGAAHRVSAYFLDYTAMGRSERVDVLDAATGAVLDTRTVSGFAGGQYLTWDLSGHVRLRVTRLAGANAVLSGLFFDSPTTK